MPNPDWSLQINHICTINFIVFVFHEQPHLVVLFTYDLPDCAYCNRYINPFLQFSSHKTNMIFVFIFHSLSYTSLLRPQ